MATVASHSDIAQFVPDYSAQFLGELQGILEKAQRFSGATGAAIAFVEGSELVTKSGLGPSAPEVGSRSPIQGSFTGLSVQTREVQRCDDASHDSRVDSQACAALGIASMVIVPIGDKSKTFGVLAAFAAKPNAFTPTHVALLRTLADIVVELWTRYPSQNGSAASSAAPSTPVNVEAPKPPASVKLEPPIKNAEPVPPPPAPKVSAPPAPKVEAVPKVADTPKVKSVNVAPGSIKLTEAPIVVPPVIEEPQIEVKREAKPVPAKSEPPRVERKPAPVVDINIARGKHEEVLSAAADIGPVVVAKAALSDAPSFGSYGASAINAFEQHRKDDTGSKRTLMIAAVLVIIAALLAGGYFFTHHGAKPGTEAKALQPAQTSPAASVPVPVMPETQPSVPASNTSAASLPAEKPVEHTTKPVEKAAAKPAEVAPKKEPAPIMVAENGAIPKRPTAENVDAPSVIPTTGGDAGGILGLVKTAQPKAAFKASQVTPPELMKRVPPTYPSFARQWHLKSERVVLNATIGKDGSVTDVKLVRGKQVFVDAAVAAVKQWKYKPAYLNGDPVPASIEVDLDFTN